MHAVQFQQSGINPTATIYVEHINRYAQLLGRRAQLLQRNVEQWVAGIRQDSNAREMRKKVFEQLESLALQIDVLRGEARDISTGAREVGDDTDANRIANGTHHDRYRFRCLLRRQCSRSAPRDD